MAKASARVSWDDEGHYQDAATRIIRAAHNGTGCHLTPAMAAAIHFAQGDGEHWRTLADALYPQKDTQNG